MSHHLPQLATAMISLNTDPPKHEMEALTNITLKIW